MCVPAVLLTIFRSEDLDQGQRRLSDIANYFGLYVPAEYTNDEIENLIHSKNPNDWGTKIHNNELNNYFREYNIPLREKYVSIQTIAEWTFTDVIKEYLSRGAHIICGYNSKYIKLNEVSFTGGHVSIILSASCDEIEILDPGPYDYGVKLIQSEKLYDAIRMKQDGLWIVERTI